MVDLHVATLALGSNLGDRAANIEHALTLLDAISDETFVINTSFLYETAPMYVVDQPSFLNCACQIETSLTPVTLLKHLKTIETTVGRVPSIRNGPRAVDLDIILYDDLQLDTRPENARGNLDNLSGELVIPHPRLAEREFVLRPICDMSPETKCPGSRRSFAQLLQIVMEITPEDTPKMYKAVPWKTSSNSVLWKDNSTRVMAVINTTPDSFSDGSDYTSLQAALEHALSAVQSGAAILDIGGYSTRPGAAFVSEDEEIDRVVPLMHAIRTSEHADLRDVLISVDTFRPTIAEKAIQAGANCINDVYAFSGVNSWPLQIVKSASFLQMRAVARKYAVPVIMMHSRGDAGSNKDYSSGVLDGITQELGAKVEAAIHGQLGLRRWNIIIDPGIGFSKTVGDNVSILRNASEIVHSSSQTQLSGYPLLIGPSRKSFLGTILSEEQHGRKTEPKERIHATSAAVSAAVQAGALIVRVHDVKEMVDVVTVANRIWTR